MVRAWLHRNDVAPDAPTPRNLFQYVTHRNGHVWIQFKFDTFTDKDADLPWRIADLTQALQLLSMVSYGPVDKDADIHARIQAATGYRRTQDPWVHLYAHNTAALTSTIRQL